MGELEKPGDLVVSGCPSHTSDLAATDHFHGSRTCGAVRSCLDGDDSVGSLELQRQ